MCPPATAGQAKPPVKVKRSAGGSLQDRVEHVKPFLGQPTQGSCHSMSQAGKQDDQESCLPDACLQAAYT